MHISLQKYEAFLTGRERETENSVFIILKIEKRKRIDFKNLANREKKEICCLKILKIEKRNKKILQLEREKHESFLLEIFSRSRLLSMTGSAKTRVHHAVPPHQSKPRQTELTHWMKNPALLLLRCHLQCQGGENIWQQEQKGWNNICARNSKFGEKTLQISVLLRSAPQIGFASALCLLHNSLCLRIVCFEC